MRYVLQALNAEWRRLATRPSARQSLRRWAADQPAFEGLRDLAEVLECRSRQPDTAAAILGALGKLAPTDDLAARTLLQALLPGIARLARTTASDDPDAVDVMVSLTWERIRTYPADRLGSVAANVLFDVRKRYRRLHRNEAPEPVLPESVFDHQGASAEDQALSVLRLRRIVEALQLGVAGHPAYRLVVRNRIDGVPLRQIAEEEQVSSHVLASRRWRTERQLLSELSEAG